MLKQKAAEIAIQNVVGVASIEQELDLEAVNSDFPAAQFNPDNFPGLVYRIQEPRSALLIFRSGKIVTTGSDSPEDAIESVNIACDSLRDLGIPIAETVDVEIVNMVCSGDLETDVNLNAVAIGLGFENVEYEPEQFPGLVYRIDDFDVVVLVFSSGKTIITGCGTIDDAHAGFERIRGKLDDLALI